MACARGDMYKITGLRLVHLVAEQYLHLPFDDINRYFPYWESSGSMGSPNEMVAP